MKVLRIGGDDYGALSFSQEHSGVLVQDIINDLDKYEPSEDDDQYWELSVHEFKGNVEDFDPAFLKWIRDQIDYDTTKHEYYYFENETIE